MASEDDLCNRAYELLCEGKAREAIELYKRALAANPEHGAALHELAMAYADEEMLDEAIETTKRLARLTPQDPLVYTDLSRLYQRKGMVAEAEAEAAKARMHGWRKELEESGGGEKT